jgi:hypothetical protein
MLAEPPIYLTKMVRCKICDASFTSAHQKIGDVLEPADATVVEMCPNAHRAEYGAGDYFLI